MTVLSPITFAIALFFATSAVSLHFSEHTHRNIRTDHHYQTPTEIWVENRMGPGVIIFALYISATTEPHWGNDRLGNTILRPGDMIRTPIYGDCSRQDIRIFVVHENHSDRIPTGEIVRRSLDVCAGLRLSPDLPWRIEIPT